MPCLTGHYSQHLSWLILASSCTHNFLTALVKFKAQVQLISLGRQGRVFRNAKTCSKLFLGKIDSELLNQVFSNWMFVLFCFVYQKRKGLSQNETTMFHFQSKNLSDIGGYVKLKNLFFFHFRSEWNIFKLLTSHSSVAVSKGTTICTAPVIMQDISGEQHCFICSTRESATKG